MENEKHQDHRVLRLNNNYTREQLRKQSQAQLAPKRRYLGLILVTVVIVLTIPTYGLIRSYQTLKKAEVTNIKTSQQSEQFKYQVASESEMIKNMQNNFYIQKFARSQYFYSKPGEKIFTTPSTTQNSTTASAGTGQ